MSSKSTIAFVFPGLADHVDPTLPVCRGLAQMGFQVEYICDTNFRDAIEETGAIFHDVDEICAQHGMTSLDDMLISDCLDSYEDSSAKTWGTKFGSIAIKILTPVFMDVFRRISPKVVVYCPIRCPYAHFASQSLKLKDVSLLTKPGPGFVNRELSQMGQTPSDIIEKLKTNTANIKAMDSLRILLDKRLSLNTSQPLFHEYYTQLNLVAKLQSLADPLSETDACVFFAQGKKFEFVGFLRNDSMEDDDETRCPELFAEIALASRSRSDIIYISMGTQLTGEDPDYGWSACAGDNLLSGKEICHAIYSVIFRTLGEWLPRPLVILGVGNQLDALPDLKIPENCRCFPTLPQLQVLQKARPALFITHGGDIAFMEAVSVGSPMIVCPCHRNDFENSKCAEKLGVGVQVNVPCCRTDDFGPDDPTEAFEASFSEALDMMLGTNHRAFKWRSQALSKEIRDSGGAARAVELIQELMPRSKRATLQSKYGI